MKNTIALILMIGGTLLMVGGIAWAAWELSTLYTGNDGMSDGPDPKKVSSAMLTAAGVGLVGFIPATVGSIMLGKGIIGLIVKKINGKAGTKATASTPIVRPTPGPKV